MLLTLGKDLAYISKRILAMSFPAQDLEATGIGEQWMRYFFLDDSSTFVALPLRAINLNFHKTWGS